MSQAPSSSTTSSPNFQPIFNAALKAYKKKTKKDLLVHPLAAQLQACNSPNDILVVLQDKVKEFDESRSADERLSRWLSPTINVLYAFSATLGQGIGLVGPIQSTFLHPPLSTNFPGVLARKRDLLRYWSPPLREHPPQSLSRSYYHTEVCNRQQRMLKQAKVPSSIYSGASRTSSSASSPIPQCLRQTP